LNASTTANPLFSRPFFKVNVMSASSFVGKGEDEWLCRDILLWYVWMVQNRYTVKEFRFTDVGRWLIEHHIPFRDEYANSHVPQSYRLHAKRTYIQARLDNLIDLGLIQKNGTIKAQKNGSQTPIYAFTIKGIYLAWIIEGMQTSDENIRQKAAKTLRDIRSSYLRDQNSSFAYFLLKFYAINDITSSDLLYAFNQLLEKNDPTLEIHNPMLDNIPLWVDVDNLMFNFLTNIFFKNRLRQTMYPSNQRIRWRKLYDDDVQI